ncbi:MAG: high frequency lysogenization protein HflD [Methylococcaceae bacterium]|jgi:high frequency lysogenization protein
MRLNTISNQTIALAGIAQAAALVQQLATTGNADLTATEASISSVLKIDSDSVIDVYGSLAGLKLGLGQLNSQLSNLKIINPDQARYCAALISLENQLSKQPEMLKTIQISLIKAQAQSNHFGLLHDNVLANLGEAYHDTISTLQPRIMVKGENVYLSQTTNVNKIRALLLAGIRSAKLWRQCRGSYWKFLFDRKKMLVELNVLLEQV